MGFVDGKVAIVSGAGRGVGRGEALELAAQGAKVVVNDYGGTSKGDGGDKGPADEVVRSSRTRGGDAIANYGDVGDWDESEDLVQGGHRRVRCARHHREQRRHPPRRVDREDDRAGLGLGDPRAPQGHVQHDAPRLRVLAERVEGRQPAQAAIVNTVSSAGLQGNQGQANYGAAKAGIAALTVITALEGKRYGVRANAIAPGGATRMVNEAMPSIPIVEADQVGPDDDFQRLNPGNSAPMVVWLASDEALHVSGQVFRAVGDEITHYQRWTLGNSVKAGREPRSGTRPRSATPSHRASSATSPAGSRWAAAEPRLRRQPWDGQAAAGGKPALDHPRQGVDQFGVVERQATRGDEVGDALDHRQHGGRRHLGSWSSPCTACIRSTNDCVTAVNVRVPSRRARGW